MRQFSRESIRAILENQIYTGQLASYRRPKFSLEDDLEHPEKIQPPKIDGDSREILESFKGKHEAIVPLKQWQHVTSLRKGKGSSSTNKEGKARIYPLSGVARCWECFQQIEKDFTLRGSTAGKNTKYYRCAYSHDQMLKRKPKTSPRIEGVNPIIDSIDGRLTKLHKYLRADKLEMQVDQLIARLVIPDSWFDYIGAYVLSPDGMAEFERAGYQYRNELRQLKDMYNYGHVSGPDFERKAKNLQEKLTGLLPMAKPGVRSTIASVRPFSKFWQKLMNIEKRIILDVIFDALYFDREGSLIRVVAHEPFDDLLDLPQDGMILEGLD